MQTMSKHGAKEVPLRRITASCFVSHTTVPKVIGKRGVCFSGSKGKPHNSLIRLSEQKTAGRRRADATR